MRGLFSVLFGNVFGGFGCVNKCFRMFWSVIYLRRIQISKGFLYILLILICRVKCDDCAVAIDSISNVESMTPAPDVLMPEFVENNLYSDSHW